ncbi:hypothetical protein AAEX28_11525 [Lentisphaerota bacterium WC36G]|nr:hypothetical protein LJT99_14360 [Lentisphaerae bacterium WC36]
MKNLSFISIKATILLIATVCYFISLNIAQAATLPFQNIDFNRSFGNPLKLKGLSDKIKIKADNVEYIGDNLIVSGDVRIKYKNLIVHADKAIVNQKSKDIEAHGNVEITKEVVEYATIPFKQYLQIKKEFRTQIKILSFLTSASGQKSVNCLIRRKSDYFLADKISGNLNSGTLKFTDFRAKFMTFTAKAKKAERFADGSIELDQVDLTTCEYADFHQEHYSVSAQKAKIFPSPQKTFGLKGYNPDPGDHSIWAYNCSIKVGELPVAWLPMFYKPNEENLGWWTVRAGYQADYGVTIFNSKKFHLSDYPWIDTNILVDIFSERGVGFGNQTTAYTENSKSNVLFWGIYDTDPYREYGNERDYLEDHLITIPSFRYDVKFTHLSHLTPQLDFKVNFEKVSDINFLKDFFRDRFANEYEVANYASLEYQNDYFSLAFGVRPKLNSFFSAVEQLPEIRLDVQRQELFSNIYFQNEGSIGYYERDWRDFDIANPNGPDYELDNYQSVRFDDAAFLYYPFKEKFFNFVPRAGLRFTYYTRSSNQALNMLDIERLLVADLPDGINSTPVTNYDTGRGGTFRLLGEIGGELNTKLSIAKVNLKNAFFNIDGLRHVVVPYINYTFITNPTNNEDKILYFNDVDLYRGQNSMRFGMRNELQTRRGGYGEEDITTIALMENYLNYHFNDEDNFSQIGDLGTILTVTPNDRISLQSIILVDLGNNNSNDVARATETPDDKGGIDVDWLNKWETNLKIKVIEDLWFNFAYIYSDIYRTRPIYSMGSTLTQIDGGSEFFGSFSPERRQTIRFGVEGVVPFDEKMLAAYNIYYDFEAGYIREQRLSIKRQIHCWEVAFEAAQRTNRADSNNDKESKYSFMGSIYLHTSPSYAVKSRETPFKP